MFDDIIKKSKNENLLIEYLTPPVPVWEQKWWEPAIFQRGSGKSQILMKEIMKEFDKEIIESIIKKANRS